MPAPPDPPPGPVGDEEARFRSGFRDAGGAPDALEHFVRNVLPCEWPTWPAPWTPGNGYLSAAQFDPGSWAGAGGGDPSDLYQVGGNVARWIARVDEWTTSGWPTCWHRGG